MRCFLLSPVWRAADDKMSQQAKQMARIGERYVVCLLLVQARHTFTICMLANTHTHTHIYTYIHAGQTYKYSYVGSVFKDCIIFILDLLMLDYFTDDYMAHTYMYNVCPLIYILCRCINIAAQR